MRLPPRPFGSQAWLALGGSTGTITEARETARLTGWQVPSGRLQLTMLLTFGTRATRVDIDNRIKTGLDALALALGFDDSRVDRIVIERVGVDPKRPLCEMILEALR